jgi:tetratricopeptide (TPR) repeat protein
MTISYCGKCGSANGTSARYCRQCGVELSSHSAFSPHATPLNVEFFPKAGTKDIRHDPRNENRNDVRDDIQSEQIIISAKGSLSADPSSAADPAETSHDPVAISKSLRRVRASGSLILEVASKKKQDEMNAIIALAIEGFDKQSEQLPARANPIFGESKRRRPLSLPPKIPSATQPLAIFADALQTAWRKAIELMTTSEKIADPAGHIATGTGPLVPTGPSIVLAQASGLNTKRNLSPKVIGGLIAIALLIGGGVYQVIRDQLLSPDQPANSERELQTAEEQSEKNVQLGKEASEREEYNSALTYFNRALSMTPNKSDVVFLIAQTYAKAGLIEDALRAYRAVLRIDPEQLQARLQLAQIHRALGNWNAAYLEFQRIIALDQNSKEANVALGAIEAQQDGLAQQSFNSSGTGRSRAVAKKSLVLPPASPVQSQMTFLSQDIPATQNIKLPASDSDKKEDNPDPRALAEAHKNLGRRYLSVKLYRPALNEFLATLLLTPDDKDIYYFIASTYEGLGQPERAYEYYTRVNEGPYLQVSQAGAKKTRKAAREAAKRRLDLLKNDLGFELPRETRKEPEGSNIFSKALLNIFR